MTPAELSALPEFESYMDEVQPNGVTVRHRIVPKHRAYPLKGDDVMMFCDEDGVWFVEYFSEGGPYKRRAPF